MPIKQRSQAGLISYLGQSGISMVEVMVGMGALVFIAVSAARFIADSSRSQRDIELEQSLNSFHATLTKVVQDVGNCNTMFGPNGSNSANQLALSLPANFKILLKGATYTIGKTSAEATPPGNTYIAKNEYIDQIAEFRAASTRTWQVTNFSFPNTTITTGSPIKDRQLVVEYTLNPRIKTRTVLKRIPLYLRFYDATHTTYPNAFVECLNPQGSSVNNFQRSVCAGLNTKHTLPNTSVTSDGTLVRFNVNDERCLREEATAIVPNVGKTLKTCHTGYVMKGFGSDGLLKCMPVDDGAEDTLPSPNPATCAAGQSLRLQRDALGRISVVCE